MARHFLDLPDAATLETEHYLLTRRALHDALAANAMAVFHGDAGLGKTFSVEDALATPDVPLIWTSFPSRPTPRLIAATLLEEITRRPTRLGRFALINRLVEHLRTPSIVVIDESQLLTPDCIELLRYLHDHHHTRFALVLVGGPHDRRGSWAVNQTLTERQLCRVSTKKPRVCGAFVDAGGGTRTPDTRIMIPLL
jgi:DNA transposition AAA+ family ATPase